MENFDFGELISKHIQKAVKQALKGVQSSLKNLDWEKDLHSKINFNNCFPFDEEFEFDLSDTISQVMKCVTEMVEDITDVFG